VSSPRVRRYKKVVANVNELLYREWAPIGFVGLLPKDEYEEYAVRVVSLLAAGGGSDEIAAYLANTAASVGGHLVSVSSVLPVATKLLSFREAARAINSAP
jgi:hypothetical protein